jgi:hypothetical protein
MLIPMQQEVERERDIDIFERQEKEGVFFSK